jgi:hypothetical protein
MRCHCVALSPTFFTYLRNTIRQEKSFKIGHFSLQPCAHAPSRYKFESSAISGGKGEGGGGGGEAGARVLCTTDQAYLLHLEDQDTSGDYYLEATAINWFLRP